MGRCSVHSRILFGVVAWLLGAATATAGSLLAVSLLGQGISGSSGQLLTQDAVNKELASAATDASQSASVAVPASAEPTGALPVSTPSRVATSAAPTPTPTAANPASVTTAPVSTPPVTTPPAPTASADGTVLTSPAGEVVASCQAAGAYLVSWSPLQGYEVGDVSRGPAATARVTFESTTSRVIMTVACSAGVPSATSYTRTGDE
jgi:serine/threonine-protein kinase